jgi:hypothetical protein
MKYSHAKCLILLVVGAATPSFAAWVFAIVCFVGAAVQFLGIWGVLQVASPCSYLPSLKSEIYSHFPRRNRACSVAMFNYTSSSPSAHLPSEPRGPSSPPLGIAPRLPTAKRISSATMGTPPLISVKPGRRCAISSHGSMSVSWAAYSSSWQSCRCGISLILRFFWMMHSHFYVPLILDLPLLCSALLQPDAA